MKNNGIRFTARPVAAGVRETETWHSFRKWFVRSLEYQATRRPYGLRADRRSSSGGDEDRERSEVIVREACAAVAGIESLENGNIRPVLDLRRARQIEVDMNAAVDRQLTQIARYLDYLEDCYGVRVAFRNGCDDG